MKIKGDPADPRIQRLGDSTPPAAWRVAWVAVALGLLSCNIPPTPPPPPSTSTPVKNTLGVWTQSAAQAGVFDGQFTTYVQSNVNTVFNFTDAISFTWNDHSIFNPNDLPSTGWPDPNVSQTFYTEWVRNTAGNTSNGVPTDAFHIYVVTHGSFNPAIGTCGSTMAGVTLHPENAVDPNSINRWTFMFGSDIDNEVAQCSSRYSVPIIELNLSLWVTTHELGHQRGGLTHPDDPGGTHLQYHQGTFGSVPNLQPDVMTGNVGLDVASAHVYPFFDMKAQNPVAADQTTCQGILAYWKSITN